MRFALDHVVIAVGDLERAIADYRSLGFTVQPGGRHPGRTSHNALVVFEDGAYLELIAWTAPNPAERWNTAHIAHGDGYMDFALIPEDVPRATAEAKARGLPLNGPIDGGRVRPDGAELKWQTARQSTFDLPFLCGDVTPRSLRVPEGEVRRHANGATGVATVVVAVADLAESIARYRALLGDAMPITPIVEMPGTGLRMVTIDVAGTAIVLTHPAGRGESLLAGEVRARLAGRGEGPCAMTLRTGSTGLLDSRKTHEALIETC